LVLTAAAALLAAVAGLPAAAGAAPAASPQPAAGQSYATVALSARDVWSVGGTDQPGQSAGDTLVEHWNGQAWQRVRSPNAPGSQVSSLDSVSAVSPTDIWASGTGAGAEGVVYTLMEHWNGRSWSRVRTPDNPASQVNYLQAVSADSARDAWAAADYTNPQGVWIPYAEHWNGSRWSIVPVPGPAGSLQTFLTGVYAFSPKDAWLVGQCIDAAGVPVALAEHWNGRRWAVTRVPGPKGVSTTGFSAIAGRSPSDLWAVGNSTTASGDTPSLIEHWNGSRWSVTPSPNPRRGEGATLAAVGVDAAGGAWAAGATEESSGAGQTVALHWTGRAWTLVPTPSVRGAQAAQLNGISLTSADDAWATGSSYTASGRAVPLNLHWAGRRWVISPPS
jgi:hypothetical protein